MKVTSSLLVLLLALLPTQGMTKQDDPLILPIKRMTMDIALKLAQETLKACRKQGMNVAVTVVDRGGHPQVVIRDTLAMDLTLVLSRQKAYTAMSFNTPTSELKGRFKQPHDVPKVDGLVLSAGGLPIQAGGSIIGGVGVSGAPSGATDENCAKAGLSAIQADLEMSEI